MIAGSKIEGGTTQTNIPARVRITIQSIKEIVKGHSDADIYAALKESNMDPNETTQKLLNQDPFHEVKRRRDKRKEVKENVVHKVPLGSRKSSENVDRGPTFPTHPDRHFRTGSYMRNMLSANGGYPRKTFPSNGRTGKEFRVVKNSRDVGTSKEFRVVKDNRVSQSVSGDKSAFQPSSILPVEQVLTDDSGKGSTETVGSQKLSGGQGLSTVSNGQFHSKQDIKSRLDSHGKETAKDKTVLQVKVAKPDAVRPRTPKVASSNSTLGLYSLDPIHVPTPESRSYSTVGAIKREVGVVGGRKKSSENSGRHAISPEVSSSNSISGHDVSSQEESNRSHAGFSQIGHAESSVLSVSTNRSSFTNQHGGKSNQQILGHQKAPHPVKEWKPKSSQKPVAKSPGVIGAPSQSKSPADKSKGLDLEAARLQDRLSQVNVHQAQNVIIPQHIRVPEADRCQLTFGSFGTEFDSTRNSVSVEYEEPKRESTPSGAMSMNATSSSEETSVNKQEDFHAEPVRDSKLDSPASSEVVELQLHEKKEAVAENFENYTTIDVVQVNTPSYTPEPQQHPELPSFSAYDPQTGYDIPYFRSTMEESGRTQVIPSPQEAVNLHVPSSTLPSTVAMMQQQQQQQQQPLAQMYPQVHVSHFANLMPYRQFMSPVYVPPVAMPGYSSNPGFPHPSNGNGYVLMPGASSHLNSNSLKYGIQQFKPVPAGSPTGFGNFASPTGFAVNAPSVVGSATGLEDSSRIKYKDGNPYIPNPPAETSEIWIQNPREHSGLQSAPFYNMPGQSPHPAYLPSHTGHASFNSAVSQSSHMQFPGLYHPPPQAAAIANPHHINPAMGGNVGVGMAAAAAGSQVGAFQQPQLGHINWTGNF